MTRTEDRLTDALGASARTVREDLLHPPVLPPHRDRRWARWLAPAAAAAVIALVAVLVAVLIGSSPAPSPAVSGAGGVPRYYVELAPHNQFLVRSTVTGEVTATVPVHAANAGDGAVAAAADGTFFAAAFISGSQEQIYHFGLTAAGQVTGFGPLPGGLLTNQATAMAATADGSRLAVAISAGPFSTSTIAVINVRTGARSVWQGGLARPGFRGAQIGSLSWTADQQLVFTTQWCKPFEVNSQACEAAEHGYRRAAEVREITTATAGGRLNSGRLLLRQSARYPFIAAAMISPDGQTITALVMHGPVERQAPGSVPRKLAVLQISATSGRQLRVLYQRPLGPTGGWTLDPDGSGTHWLLDGFDSYGNGEGPRNQMNLGYNGWISDGRLIPLQPATGTIGEAW
jgi:hypothetical protein